VSAGGAGSPAAQGGAGSGEAPRRRSRAGALGALLSTPLRDLLAGLDLNLEKGVMALAWIGAGLVAGWFVYVPVHELAHAAGCVAAGGRVTRLEIDAVYGAALLQRVFPFVAVGSDYAGQLTDFDTGGSDLTYLATDLAPFLFTLFPGVWWLRRAARRRRPFLFGAALPWALAPFVSLTGDAYEIGSLAAVHLPPAAGERSLIGDDLARKWGELEFAARPELAGGLAVALLVAVVWAFAWYLGAGALARRLGEPALSTAAR
jgi:hypothetical protein